jgi:hypothetical protein
MIDLTTPDDVWSARFRAQLYARTYIPKKKAPVLPDQIRRKQRAELGARATVEGRQRDDLRRAVEDPPFRCQRCNERIARQMIAAEALCLVCAGEILHPIRTTVIALHGDVDRHHDAEPVDTRQGFGDVVHLRDDYAPGFAMLRCSVCSARWVGPPDEWCSYCFDRIEREDRYNDEAEAVIRREGEYVSGWLRCTDCQFTRRDNEPLLERDACAVRGGDPQCRGRLHRFREVRP